MSIYRTAISSLFLLIFSVWSVSAQGDCAIDVAEIIASVTNECADIGANEVCYGNRDVSVTPRVNTVDFMFENPGDRAALHNIQSLVVNAVDTDAGTWGVAQMRLLVGSDSGVQDITMLLFGETEIENAVNDAEIIDLRVATRERAIHREPNISAAQIEIVESGALLTGLARLEDSSWLRVENPVTRVVGWVENSGLVTVDEALSIGLLAVNDSETPYYGAMQAFYFENGSSDIGCDSVESDGLLIQTPEGAARVSLLINEVSIELVGTRNEAGENVSGTAFIQANPLVGQDMSVNVVSGSATVQTVEGEQSVGAGQQTTIPISVDLRPSGAPEEPIEFEANSINVAPLVPAVSAPRDNPTNNGDVTVSNSSGNGSSSGDSGNSSGINIQTGNGSANSSGNGDSSSNSNGTSSSNSGNSSSSGSGLVTGSGNSNGGNDSSQSSGNSNAGQTTGLSTATSNGFGGGIFSGPQGNLLALSIAVISGLIVISFIVWYTRRNRA